MRSCEIWSEICGLRRIDVVQRRNGSVNGKYFYVCKKVVGSVSGSVSEIQDGMVILNVGMMKGVEIVILIGIWSVC